MVRTGGFAGWEPDLLLGFDLKGKMLGVAGTGTHRPGGGAARPGLRDDA